MGASTKKRPRPTGINKSRVWQPSCQELSTVSGHRAVLQSRDLCRSCSQVEWHHDAMASMAFPMLQGAAGVLFVDSNALLEDIDLVGRGEGVEYASDGPPSPFPVPPSTPSYRLDPSSLLTL